jgi:hypothetical protein
MTILYFVSNLKQTQCAISKAPAHPPCNSVTCPDYDCVIEVWKQRNTLDVFRVKFIVISRHQN